jgi:hypothetical protein
MACYSGPNPVNDEDRLVIWKWAKENGIDAGIPINKISELINERFFGGAAPQEWMTDIMSGRKTPYKILTNDAWKKQYNRRTIVENALDMVRKQAQGPIGKAMEALYQLPRSVSVAYHFTVFPFSHAGDLVFRPENWGTFVQGLKDTYGGSFSKGYAARALDAMERDNLYGYALRSGLDAGPKSHPVGILSKFLSSEMSERSWKMLTIMRFQLWKSQMVKWAKPIRPDMKPEEVAEVLDYGKNLATWANHATGSGKGPVATLGGNVVFGPKLTQSKLNRMVSDPLETIKTFGSWDKATPGQKAVAWTRMSGATQYLLTYAGFLAVNQGVLSAFGSKQKVNWTDPGKADFLAFKGVGLEGYIPGLHTEIKTLAKILATSWMSRKELRGESRYGHTGTIMSQYGMAKLTPSLETGLELLHKQNWRGQPVPWSSEKGTKHNPRLTWGEYAGSHAPIPLEGPIKYVYDHLKQNGASSMDAMAITKGLIITGLGATGVHVQEEK